MGIASHSRDEWVSIGEKYLILPDSRESDRIRKEGQQEI